MLPVLQNYGERLRTIGRDSSALTSEVSAVYRVIVRASYGADAYDGDFSKVRVSGGGANVLYSRASVHCRCQLVVESGSWFRL